jgi:hypothetical protein
MYSRSLLFHIVTSSFFVIIAIVLTIRSITGWTKDLKYSKTDKYLAFVFLILLYITLVNGALMYFLVDNSSKTATDINFAIKRASLRFWVVEHFYVMTFALILSQIGGIFIRKSTRDKDRFGYAAFYYGIATLITIISVTSYFFYR